MSSSTSTSSSLLTPIQGGQKHEKFSWTQDIFSVTLTTQVPEGTTVKRLKISLKPKHFTIHLLESDNKTWQLHLGGETENEFDVGESSWELEDRRIVNVHFQKKAGYWWECVFQGDPKIDINKIPPPQTNISELTPEMQNTVEKMLLEQAAKQGNAGFSLNFSQIYLFFDIFSKFFSDAKKKLQEDKIKEFQKAHPSLDLSQFDLSNTEFT